MSRTQSWLRQVGHGTREPSQSEVGTRVLANREANQRPRHVSHHIGRHLQDPHSLEPQK